MRDLRDRVLDLMLEIAKWRLFDHVSDAVRQQVWWPLGGQVWTQVGEQVLEATLENLDPWDDKWRW